MVLISHELRCIFVHQKKAAGTSIKRVFPDFVPGSPESSYLSDGVADPKWNFAPEVKKYHKFTVVRNPWDRFVSGWLYCNRTKRRKMIDVLQSPPNETISIANIFGKDQSWASKTSNLFEYVSRSGRNARMILRGIPKEFRDWQGHDYIHIVRQQHETFLNKDGSLAVDQILFYEDLEKGLIDLEKVLGAPLERLQRTNENSNRRDYRHYFDDVSLELFNQAFAKDIEILGYDFDTGKRSLA